MYNVRAVDEVCMREFKLWIFSSYSNDANENKNSSFVCVVRMSMYIKLRMRELKMSQVAVGNSKFGVHE